ncbi:MAG: hypothetical protein V1811_00770 [Candidatus Micrarchaeota archaeon]
MKKVEFQEIILAANGLNDRNQNWHFHMLTKDCKFNAEKGHFLIVFENEGSGEVLYSFFSAKPLKESKSLLHLMLGDDFLEKQEKDVHNPDFDLILKKAEDLVKQKADWHHHYFTPNCIFNKTGKHCVLVEDPMTGAELTAVYDQKPAEDLVKLEKLFYRGMK